MMNIEDVAGDSLRLATSTVSPLTHAGHDHAASRVREEEAGKDSDASLPQMTNLPSNSKYRTQVLLPVRLPAALLLNNVVVADPRSGLRTLPTAVGTREIVEARSLPSNQTERNKRHSGWKLFLSIFIMRGMSTYI